jgi:hypothetical protein
MAFAATSSYARHYYYAVQSTYGAPVLGLGSIMDCGAVHCILIKSRGEYFNHWWVQLNAGNDPTWLKPHLPILLKRIRAAKDEAGYGAPRAITVFAPDMPEISYSVRSKK